MTDDARPPFPPFDRASAMVKVQAAEDAWNTCDPRRVSLAYTEDSVWRNRDQFVTGRAEIVDFLTAKWERELDYALRKSLWSFDGNRIAVRFQYECRRTQTMFLAVSGTAATATSSGSSTSTASCSAEKPASTTSRSMRRTDDTSARGRNPNGARTFRWLGVAVDRGDPGESSQFEYVGDFGQPSGESCHSSWRPHGRRSINAKLWLSCSVPRPSVCQVR